MAALLATLGVGCGSPSMVELAVPLPGLPRAGTAMVVFVQPSTYAENEYFPIVDQRGRFLGDSEPATWFLSEVPPGPAVRANLVANRTYFIEVASRFGLFKPRVQLLPIAPRFSTWDERETWLAETRAQGVGFASQLDPDDLAEIVADGQENLADYTSEELERRTLLASDGI